MKRPLDRGAEISAKRYTHWTAEFSGYRNPVTEGMIERWLDQFTEKDQDLAARILDAVHFVGNQHIHTIFRQMLNSISGWHANKAKRRGRWFFVPFSGSVGESGDTMVHAFRMANSMTKAKYDYLFFHRSELTSMKPSHEDTVILIDDFAGTGNQASNSWRKFFEELLPGKPRIILMLVAATQVALAKIKSDTEMNPVLGTVLSSKDNLFHADCTFFSKEEKTLVEKYCMQADQSHPKGYGESGLLVVLAHRCPNNSLPILHASSRAWSGLFPRDE